MTRPTWLLGLLVAVAGCTRPNPDFCSTAADCKDPTRPFCDVDGTISGLGNSCVAMPMPDAATAIDAPPGGCTPGQVLGCNGGTLTTCASDGHTTTGTTCALGCNGDGLACKQAVPSNNLEQYIDQTTTPVDITLAGGTLDLDTSKFTPTSGSAFTLPSFKVAAPTGGAPITVFVGKKITLGKLVINTAANPVTDGVALSAGSVGPAVAFLATDQLSVLDRVLVASGAVDVSGCNGGTATKVSTAAGAQYFGGGGGGANATDGGDGGSIPTKTGSATHGSASGADSLVPLRGGCPGGNSGNLLPGKFGGRAGGAIQLFSRSQVYVNAAVVADGLVTVFDHTVGGADVGGATYGGGGGGGGILVEAPVVTLDLASKLLARGGAGGNGPILPQDNGVAIPSGSFAGTDPLLYAPGGAGATATAAPGNGASTGTPVSGESIIREAGGGGGGVGRIRINTTDTTFAQAATAILAGRTTTGLVGAQ